MKKNIFILLVLCIMGGLCRIFAEDYILKPIEGGNLFFVTPFEIPSLNKGIVPLKVDITALTFEDSVDWRTTLSVRHEISIDSIYIEAMHDTIIVPVYKIYVEKEKNNGDIVSNLQRHVHKSMLCINLMCHLYYLIDYWERVL